MLQDHDEDSRSFIQFQDQVQILRPINMRNPTNIKSKHREMQLQNDLGIYNSIRIKSYQGSKNEGKLLRLIYFDNNKNQFDIDMNSLQLFQKYAAYQIAFISIVGEKSNGKSFILDKILNLSGVKGNHFTSNQQKGIFIWSQPFKKRNIKVFLIDCQGFKSGQLTTNQIKLNQLLLFLSHSVIFNHKSSKIGQNSNGEDLNSMQQIVELTFKNFTYQNKPMTKQTSVLASCFYHLSRKSKNIINKYFEIYFKNYNFTCLQDAMNSSYKGKDQDLIDCSFLITNCISQKFIRNLAQIFNHIIQNIQQRMINNISYNGNIMSKLLSNIIIYLNKSSKIQISKIYKNIINQLYISAYNYCLINYGQILQQQLRDEKPVSFDQLLKIFSRAGQDTLGKFHQFNLEKQLHLQYLSKLQEYINLKEGLILQINKKKTLHALQTQFPFDEANNADDGIKKLQQFKNYRSELDHGRQEILQKYTLKLLDGLNKNFGSFQLGKKIEQKRVILENLNVQLKQKVEIQSKMSKQIQKNQKQQNELRAKLQKTNKKLEIDEKKKQQLKKYVNQIQNFNQDDKTPQNQLEQNKLKLKQYRKKIQQLTNQQKTFNSIIPQKKQVPNNAAKLNQIQNLKKKQALLKKQQEGIDKQINDLKIQINAKFGKK